MKNVNSVQVENPESCRDRGILFSVVFAAVFVLFRIFVPADPVEPGEWLRTNPIAVAFSLNLVPFAGIAFLWFLGVLRDRLGVLEDRFFATVLLGSSLLFLAMLFASAAVLGAVILAFTADSSRLMNAEAFHFARAVAYNMVNIYMIKMAAAFMISTSTVVVYTNIAPRWVAFLGLGLGLLLLFGSSYLSWAFIAFPLWVFLFSACLLVDEFR